MLLSTTSSTVKAAEQFLFVDSGTPNQHEVTIFFGDKRLNNIAALTFNIGTCDEIFSLIYKALKNNMSAWRTIHKALLLLRTIVLYGPEIAIDKVIDLSHNVYQLTQYNTALVKKGLFGTVGGIDYGEPVREAAKTLFHLISSDANIRKARTEAKGGESIFIPVGEETTPTVQQIDVANNLNAGMMFGQKTDKMVGAGFSMNHVPGMYEGRPERYFDNANDFRNRNATVQDSQHTRDAQAPNLLDLAFDNDSSTSNTASLPDPLYLPAIERQKQLEEQLKQQQVIHIDYLFFN